MWQSAVRDVPAGPQFADWLRQRTAALGSRTPTLIGWPPAPPNFRPSAVLIPLWEQGGRVFTALTLRSARLNAHAGQISFPGGRRDPEDPSLLHTALREAHEELAILPESVEVHGALDDAWSIHSYVVTPWVGWLDKPPVLVPEPSEIERVIVADVEQMMQPGVYSRREIERGSARFAMHAWQVGEDNVWGLTGGLLYQFFCHLLDRTVEPESQGLLTIQRFLNPEE